MIANTEIIMVNIILMCSPNNQALTLRVNAGIVRNNPTILLRWFCIIGVVELNMMLNKCMNWGIERTLRASLSAAHY